MALRATHLTGAFAVSRPTASRNAVPGQVGLSLEGSLVKAENLWQVYHKLSLRYLAQQITVVVHSGDISRKIYLFVGNPSSQGVADNEVERRPTVNVDTEGP
jgi:hypothetical protein